MQDENYKILLLSLHLVYNKPAIRSYRDHNKPVPGYSAQVIIEKYEREKNKA